MTATSRATGSVVLVSIAFALSVASVRADESRIPIYRATTITQPGHYILTRNFTVSSGNAIDIQADQVTLDLNGRTITITGATSYGVNIADGYRWITIKNGTIAGGSSGVSYTSSTIPGRVRVENVMFRNISVYGVYLSFVEEVDVRSCTFHTIGASAISIFGGSTIWRGRIANNHITGVGGWAVWLDNGVGVALQDNDVAPGLSGGGGVLLSGTSCRGIEFSGNRVVETAVGSPGLAVSCPGTLVVGNVFSRTGSWAIELNHSDARVVRNIITGAFGTPGDGVRVNGTRNVLEDNHIQGNPGCGLNFSNANNHVYRDNLLRGNTGGAVCGSANTDAGGNVL